MTADRLIVVDAARGDKLVLYGDKAFNSDGRVQTPFGAGTMALYYFVLKSRWNETAEEEGFDLPDAEAAREHALVVARELVRNTAAMDRFSRIAVCDDYLMPLFEVDFTEADPAIDHLDPHYRGTIEQVARSTAFLHDALLQTRSALAQVKETFARVDRLMAQAGQMTPHHDKKGGYRTGGST